MRTIRAIEIGLCVGLLVGVTLGFVGGVGLVVKKPERFGLLSHVGSRCFPARTLRDLTRRKAQIQALDLNLIKSNRIWVSCYGITCRETGCSASRHKLLCISDL